MHPGRHWRPRGSTRDAGASDTDFSLARFFPDGRLDGSFSTNGRVTNGFGGDQYARAVVVQPDRKIVLGGHVGAHFALVRLTETGLADYAFGTSGQTVTDMGGDDYLNTPLLTPGCGFVAAGNWYLNGNSDCAIAQYGPNGVQLDPGLRQPWAKAFIDCGSFDLAIALDWQPLICQTGAVSEAMRGIFRS